MMSQASQSEILHDAAELLREAPFGWTVTVEYPGYLWVAINNGDDEETRYYAAGFANPTLTVDQQDEHCERTYRSVDTHVATHMLDGYRLAIHTAAAIDRMEHLEA